MKLVQANNYIFRQEVHDGRPYRLIFLWHLSSELHQVRDMSLLPASSRDLWPVTCASMRSVEDGKTRIRPSGSCDTTQRHVSQYLHRWQQSTDPVNHHLPAYPDAHVPTSRQWRAVGRTDWEILGRTPNEHKFRGICYWSEGETNRDRSPNLHRKRVFLS
jgi:hypothetical protein